MYHWVYIVCNSKTTFSNTSLGRQIRLYQNNRSMIRIKVLWIFRSVCIYTVTDFWTLIFVSLYYFLHCALLCFSHIYKYIYLYILYIREEGVYPQISALFLHENICCWYSSEAPWHGLSNKSPLHMLLWRNKKTINIFLLKKAPYQELCIILYSQLLG